MLRYIILLCGFLFIIANSKSNGCHPVKREFGELFRFVCPEYHNGKSHFYHYNLSTGQHQLVYNNSHRFKVIINNLDDAGEYCCSKHPGETLLINQSHCCIQVEVPTTIQWDLPEEAPLHGDINGSLTFMGNPVPTGDLNVYNCQYKSSTTMVNEYTVSVNFIVYDITKSCRIYYHSETHIEMKTLTIATTTNTTASDNLSLPTTISPMSKPNITTDQLATSTLSIPTQNTTNITEQKVKDKITTDTDSSRTETTIDSLQMMVILSVAISFILLLITGLSLSLLLVVVYIWICTRKI